MTIIAQLSDLHLSGQVGEDVSYRRFLAVLAQALTKRPDCLLLTGDLVNGGRMDAYDWLFALLDKQKLPYMCLAGNHDVSVECGNFYTLKPAACHPAISNTQVCQLGSWQLIGLNSAVAGCIHGRLSDNVLHFLTNHLSNHSQPTIIALHHHPKAVGSAWIDAHKLANAHALARAITPFSQVKALVCGHIHQAHSLLFAGVPLFTCPAVARQFLPFFDDFALDDKPAGFRLISLTAQTLTTSIHRLY